MKPANTTISIIVAHSNNRVIGHQGSMPWHLPRDLQWFKSHTTGHPVIMGRKTYESIGRALPNRRNLVISSHAIDCLDIEVYPSLSTALEAVANCAQAFIIGGGMLYRAALEAHVVDRLLITHVDVDLSGDTTFPMIDEQDWQQDTEEFYPADEQNLYHLRFCIYHRRL